MHFRRISTISVIALLAGWTSALGFQVTSHPTQLGQPTTLIARPIVPISHLAAPVAMNHPSTQKPATLSQRKSRELLRTHINFPRRRPARGGVRVHKFTFGGGTGIIRSHQTSVSASGGTISILLDLGQPRVSVSALPVKNTPQGMKFSQLEWPLLTSPMPNGLTLIPSEGGGPDIPILTVTFAIPSGATNIIPVIEPSRTAPLGTIHIIPSEQEVNDTLERIYDAPSYSVAPRVTIAKPETFRSLRMVTVRVPLVETNGRAALRSFTVGIRFNSNSEGGSGTVKDPLFADLNSRTVTNDWDLGRFAVPLRQAAGGNATIAGKGMHSLSGPTGFDSVFNWIDPTAPYVRVAVTRDGLYRVSANELNFSTLGFTPVSAGWNPKNLRCINHGKEIPIWIDTDASGNIAAIEFYGQHLRGFPLPSFFDITYPELPRPEYYNVATDTNVYWLTSSIRTGPSTPLRFRERTQYTPSAPVISSGSLLLHHEQDHNYYQGDAVADATTTIQRTEYVSGERFYWTDLHGLFDDSTKSHFADTFYIAKLPVDTAGKFATVKFLFRGISDDATHGIYFHYVDAQVNNSAPSFIDRFGYYSYDSLSFTVPLSKLVLGANIVRVNALTGGTAGVDQFYLDYYEVSFESGLAPSIDSAIAKGQWLFSESPTSRMFQLALSDTTAHLFNLTDTTRLELHAGLFFDSAVSLNPHYAAATPASILKCDNIQPWNTGNSRVQGWNILGTGNQADYLVITHPEFLHEAQELANNRGNVGMKTMVVTTDEVFNAFDYGSNEPVAIRRFLNFAYQNYSGTPVAFVTLLGDASWDPKFNTARTPQDFASFHRSFVPTYGWPASDYYYTLPGTSDSGLNVPPLMVISRIPGSSEPAIQSYITKLVEYENEPPASWNRNWLFLSGGDGGAQHAEFDIEIRSWLGADIMHGESGLVLPPTNIDSTIIERTDFTSGVDATHVGQIEDALQRGQSILYFAGHGATFTSDISFPDASILNNKGLYPLLMTLTCQTGAFAEPDLIGVNESYVDASEAGSVQAYGTTGFGASDYDGHLTTNFFQHLQTYDSTHDTTKTETMNMLALLTVAKGFADQFSSAAGADASHNGTLQNSMLGDAATGFVFRPQPEFAVYPNEVHAYAGSDTVARVSLSVSDSVMTIRALIHNYGYSADRPVVIRITDAGPSGLPFSLNDTLPRLDTSAIATATFALTAQSIGEHTISVLIDPDSAFPESYRPDDLATIQVRVNGLSTTPFYPYEGSRDFCDISPSAVHLIVLTPSGTSAGDQVELELDTTQAFSNILADQKATIGSAYYLTFDVPIPASPVPFSSVYWWRSRVLRANGDATDWQYATFSTASAPRPEFSYTSREQDSSMIVSGLSLDSRGFLFLPAHDTEIITAWAHGQNDSAIGAQAYSQISINGKHIYEDGVEGVAIVVFTPDGTQIESASEFDMDWSKILGNPAPQDSAARIFDSVLASIQTGRRVIVLTVGQMDFQNFLDSTRIQMQTLGSLNGLTPPYTGSYALIGTKGSPPGTAKEGNAQNGTNGTTISDTIVTSGISGLAVTPFTAIAKNYGALTWTGDPVPAGSDITFQVLGERRDGTGIDSVDAFHASQGSSFDLSNINPRVYDRLGVQMNFVRTSNATQSPALSGIALQYDAAPELLFSSDSIQTNPKLTNAGGAVLANYGVIALTCTPADSVPLLVTRTYQGKTDTVALHELVQLAGHGTQSFADSIQTTNELGSVALAAAVNPNDTVNEQLLFNDNIAGTYTVVRDTTRPTIQILFDNRNIPDGGYVSSNATIQINLLSSNLIRDTAHNSIVAASLIPINGSSTENFHIYYYDYSAGFRQPEFGTFQSGPTQAWLRFRPSAPYSPGQWLITAAVTDASGNTDTVRTEFTISNVNGLEEVMNYPNPFKDKTDFTFVLKSDQPADVKIIIYTIAGRKIRTLTPLETHAGFNAVEWDGRDERGNDVADGTYLYRVIINGKDGDNVSDAVTERAVRDR